MTFNREVLSCAIYPALLESKMISGDAKERVNFLMGDMSSPMGAYTGNSKGYNVVRKTIAKYIEQRDGNEVSANHNKIYLTNGASEGVRMAFKLLLRD
jgi:aspartate/methionine/tyrosine aminotransferase